MNMIQKWRTSINKLDLSKPETLPKRFVLSFHLPLNFDSNSLACQLPGIWKAWHTIFMVVSFTNSSPLLFFQEKKITLFADIISLFIFSEKIKMLSPFFLTFDESGMDCECDVANWQKDLILTEFLNQPVSKNLIKPVTLMKTDVANKCAAELQPARLSYSCHKCIWKFGFSIDPNLVLLYNVFCSWTTSIFLSERLHCMCWSCPIYRTLKWQ